MLQDSSFEATRFGTLSSQIGSAISEVRLGFSIMPEQFNSDSSPREGSVIALNLGSTSRPESDNREDYQKSCSETSGTMPRCP